MRLAVVVAWLLCAGVAHAEIKLAPLYAAMFEKGHTWTYAVTSYGKRRDVTCKVEEVVVWERSIASRIECDDSISEFTSSQPDGVWVATAEGIARPIGRDAMTNKYDALPYVIAMPAKPAVGSEKGAAIHKRTSPAKGTWCNVVDASRGTVGEPLIRTTCYREGVGIVSGKIEYLTRKVTDSFVLASPTKR